MYRMPIIIDELVTDKITSTGTLTLTSNSDDIQIGSFAWPSTTSGAADGSVLKTNSSGGLSFEPATIRSEVTGTTYSIQVNDDIVALTINQATNLILPDPTLKNVGDLIYCVREVAGTAVTTIVPETVGTLINGETSVTMSFSFGSVKIYTNGINWFALF